MCGRSIEVIVPSDGSDREGGGSGGGDVELQRRFASGTGAGREKGPLYMMRY